MSKSKKLIDDKDNPFLQYSFDDSGKGKGVIPDEKNPFLQYSFEHDEFSPAEKEQIKQHTKNWVDETLAPYKRKPIFDPEGEGYDYETAEKYGIEPDSTGHYPSRVPETGQLLKGKKHPTFHKTEKAEKELGYNITKGEDGRYYSQKNIFDQEPEELPELPSTIAESSSTDVSTPKNAGFDSQIERMVEPPNEKVKRLRSNLFGNVPPDMTENIQHLGQIPERWGEAIGNLPIETIQQIQPPIRKNDPNIQLGPSNLQLPGGLTQEDQAGAFNILNRAMGEDLNITQAEKSFRTQGEDLAGSLGQGALSSIGGMARIPEAVGIETFKGIADNLMNAAEHLSPNEMDYMQKVVSGFGSMASFMIPGTIAGMIGKALSSAKLFPYIAAGTSGLLEAMAEGGSVYDQVMRETGNHTLAQEATGKTFLANLILVPLTNKLGIFGDAAEGIKKGLLSAPIEGLQEGMQEIISSLSQGGEINWNNVIESAGIGAIVGGGTGTVISSNQDLDFGPMRLLDPDSWAMEKSKPYNAQKDVRGKPLSEINIYANETTPVEGLTNETDDVFKGIRQEYDRIIQEQQKEEEETKKKEKETKTKEIEERTKANQKRKEDEEREGQKYQGTTDKSKIKRVLKGINQIKKDFTKTNEIDERRFSELHELAPTPKLKKAVEDLYSSLQNEQKKTGPINELPGKSPDAPLMAEDRIQGIIKPIENEVTEGLEPKLPKIEDLPIAKEEENIVEFAKKFEVKPFEPKPQPGLTNEKLPDLGKMGADQKVKDAKKKWDEIKKQRIPSDKKELEAHLEELKGLKNLPAIGGPIKKDLENKIGKRIGEVQHRIGKLILEEQKPKEKESKPEVKQADDVVRFPIKDIVIDTERFQNRDELDEDHVNNIVKNWNEKDFGPIDLWKDPKDGKVYLLAGHHRLESAKRVGLKDVKSTMRDDFKTEGQAIEYAKERSNENRKTEKPHERANYYRGLREKGENPNEIKKRIKEIHGKNANYIENLSYLSKDGNAIITLKQMENDGDAKKIADWIGNARKNYDQLTDDHEEELYNWLKNTNINRNNQWIVNNKLTFLDRVDALVNNFDFNKDKPLNIAERIGKSSMESEYDAEVTALENELKAAKKTLEDKRKEFIKADKKGEELNELLKKYNDNVTVIQRELLAKKQQKGNIQEEAQNQSDLFSQIANEGIDEEQAKEIIEGTDPSELEKLASDIESKEKSKESLTDEEIQDEIDDVDDKLFQKSDLFNDRTELQKLQDEKRHLEYSLEELERVEGISPEARKHYPPKYLRDVNTLGRRSEIQKELKRVNRAIDKELQNLDRLSGQTDMFGEEYEGPAQGSLFQRHPKQTKDADKFQSTLNKFAKDLGSLFWAEKVLYSYSNLELQNKKFQHIDKTDGTVHVNLHQQEINKILNHFKTRFSNEGIRSEYYEAEKYLKKQVKEALQKGESLLSYTGGEGLYQRTEPRLLSSLSEEELAKELDLVNKLLPNGFVVKVVDKIETKSGETMTGYFRPKDKTIGINKHLADLTTIPHEILHASLFIADPNVARTLLKLNGWDGKGEISDFSNDTLRKAHEAIAEKFEKWYNKNERYATIYDRFFQKLKALFQKLADFVQGRLPDQEVQYFKDLANGDLNGTYATGFGEPGFVMQKLKDIFYSKVEEVLREKAPGKNIRFKTLWDEVKFTDKNGEEQTRYEGLLGRAGVKAEEMEWLDIETFLKEHPTATKDQLIEYVKSSNVKIDEILKGGALTEGKLEKIREKEKEIIEVQAERAKAVAEYKETEEYKTLKEQSFADIKAVDDFLMMSKEEQSEAARKASTDKNPYAPTGSARFNSKVREQWVDWLRTLSETEYDRWNKDRVGDKIQLWMDDRANKYPIDKAPEILVHAYLDVLNENKSDSFEHLLESQNLVLDKYSTKIKNIKYEIERIREDKGNTKFGRWQLEGDKENYGELLLTLNKGDEYAKNEELKWEESKTNTDYAGFNSNEPIDLWEAKVGGVTYRIYNEGKLHRDRALGEFKTKIMQIAAQNQKDYDPFALSKIEDALDWIIEEPIGTPERDTSAQWKMIQKAVGKNTVDLNELHDIKYENRDTYYVWQVDGDLGRSNSTLQEAKLTANYHARNNRAIKRSKNNFTKGHYAEDNVLTHIRFNDRTDENGKRMLFIEEVQSDWHQKGRRFGYSDKSEKLRKEAESKIAEIEEKIDELIDKHNLRLFLTKYPNGMGASERFRHSAAIVRFKDYYKWVTDFEFWGNDGQSYPSWFDDAAVNKFKKIDSGLPKNQIRSWIMDHDSLKMKIREGFDTGIPDAPFKKSWHELALKRMLRYAAENGYDTIGWTTGEQQADRYNLAKYVHEIKHRKNADGTYWFFARVKDGQDIEKTGLTESDLEDQLGKEIAQKIVNREGDIDESYTSDAIRERGRGLDVFPIERANIVEHPNLAGRYWLEYDGIYFSKGYDERGWEKGRLEREVERNGSRSWYIEFENEIKGVWLSREDAQKEMESINEEYFDAPPENSQKILSNLDLQVGGEGMKGFYNKMLPSFLNKYGKKWGASVGESGLKGKSKDRYRTDNTSVYERADGNFALKDIYEKVVSTMSYDTAVTMSKEELHEELVYLANWADKELSREKIHSFPITDKMKASVLQGQTLFQKQRSRFGKQMFGKKSKEKSDFSESDLNDVIRLKDIGKNLAKNIDLVTGQHVRTGRKILKRFGSMAGFYDPLSGLVRLQNIKDVGVLAHELGHKLDFELFNATDQIKFSKGDKLDGIVTRANGIKDAARREKTLETIRNKYGAWNVDSLLERAILRADLKKLTIGVGHYSNKTVEGVAEFISNYITDPELCTRFAPTFSQFFEKLLDNAPEIRKVLLESREQVKNFQEQDPRQITESTISRDDDTDGFLSSIVKKGKRFYIDVIDGTDSFRKLEKQLLEKEPRLKGEDNPLKQVLSLIGIDGKAKQFLENHPFQRAGNDVNILNDVKPFLEIFSRMLKDGNLKSHEGYLTALRNLELYNNGKPQAATTTKEIAEKSIKLYEDQLGKDYLDQLVDDLREYNNALLDYYQQSGKISKEQLEQIKELNQYYVPFKRFFDEWESSGQMPNVSKYVKDSSPSPVKGIKGSMRDIVSPIGSIIKNTYDMIAAADRNRSLEVVVDALRTIDKTLVQQIPARVFRSVSVIAQPKVIEDPDTGDLLVSPPDKFTEKRIGVFYEKPKNAEIITVFKDGKPIYYQIPKEYYDSFFAINEQLSRAIKVLSLPSRILQAGAVVFDPTFAVRNIPRDQMSALFYSKHGYNPFDFIKGVLGAAKKDELYQKFLASGADQSFLTAMDVMLSKNYMEEKVGKRIQTTFQRYKRNPLIALQDLNRATELGTRVGAFRKAYLKTGDLYKSMQEGREISADYGVKGLSMKNISPLYPFLNARIQHVRMTGEAAKKHPYATVMKGLAFVSVPTLLNWILNNWDDDDREQYKELPEWRKLIFFNIHIPGTDSYLPLPKGFWGTVWGTPIEYFMDWVTKNEPIAAKEIAKQLFEELSPMSSWVDLMPQFGRPFLEQWANKKGFTDRPIISKRIEDLEPEEQYYDDTPELLKEIGKGTGLSPARLESLITGFTAGAGRGALYISDEILQMLGIVDNKPEDTFTVLSKLPLTKALFTETPIGTRGRSVQNFYSKLDELEEINKQVNRYVSDDETEKLNDYMEDKKDDYKYYLMNSKEINKFKVILRYAQSIKRDITKDESIKNKREKIKELENQMTELAKGFAESYKNNTKFKIGEFMNDFYRDYKTDTKEENYKRKSFKGQMMSNDQPEEEETNINW